MDRALADLIKVSNVTGKDSTLVQGGGGNTSVKTADGKYMYIKASGTALRDMNAKQGWRRMGVDAVLAILHDKSLAALDVQKRETEVVNRLLLACDDRVTGDTRPSVEAHLHALLGRCVIHLHPIVVGAYVNAKNGLAELVKPFEKSEISEPAIWVPYTDPGFMLAKKIANLIKGWEKVRSGTEAVYKRVNYTQLVKDLQNPLLWEKPAIIFLQKHGLIISAETADDALRLVRKVINICKSKLKGLKTQDSRHKTKVPKQCNITAAKLAIRKAVFDATGQYLPVSYFPITEPVAAFMARKDAGKLLSTAALNPDELVYANGSAMWIEKCDANLSAVAEIIAERLKALISKGQKPSAAFVAKGLGLFVAADKKTAPVIAEITTGSLQIRTWATKFGGILALTKRQQDFINQWESEAFRKRLASGATGGELQNRIAVVTGAGSGLGRSIAIGLARAGAMVALVDINEKDNQQTDNLTKAEMPQVQTMIIRCDVTNDKNVKGAFGKVLENWGGLDILVNAAGIAPAYPLVDIPVEKWRAALEVNLTGYFLMAKEVARIMIAQGIGGSIINISSKSGLEASKDNTAYNATKAGEIHIARGWALELGEYGIRVNSIAAGNVFEGSKIWNPQYIRVCAKKYGIKPQEVIPFYVSKTALKREIKGQDVADSVVFLCSDRARTITGQTLVPDSGQVMVR